MRRHRVKEESGGASRRRRRRKPETDLLDLVHDRVQLLQEVFPCFSTPDLRAMLPDSMKNLPMSHIKELCLEELLGISTKRLIAVIAGEPIPSDTESSSDEERAPMSLDSISSDEGVLDNVEKKRKQKESKKRSKKKDKSRKGRKSSQRAERSGLTVLELLELQARARAIRAQLQAEPQPLNSNCYDAANASTVHEVSGGEDDDVLIKEEPPEVVELSSDDDVKPNVPQLQETTQQVAKPVKQEDDQETTSNTTENSQSPTVIKRNDLTIIVPKAQTSKRVKLNRAKFAPKATENQSTDTVVANKPATNNNPATNIKPATNNNPATNNKPDQPNLDKKEGAAEEVNSELPNLELQAKTAEAPVKKAVSKPKYKTKGKKQKKTRTKSLSKSSDKEDSDRDEIMLQLSDSEKMDLLKECYPSKQRKQISSSSEDSQSTTSEDEPTSDDLESDDSQEDTQPQVEVKSKNLCKIKESNNKDEQPDLDLDKNREQQQIAAREITESEIQGSKDLAVNKTNEVTVADEMKNKYEEVCLVKEANGAVENIVDKESVASTVEKCDDIEEKDCSNESEVSQIQLGTKQISPRSENKTEIIEQTAEEAPNLENIEPLAKKDSDFSITKSEVKAPLDNVPEEAVNESNDDAKTDSTDVSSDAAKDTQSPSQKKACKKKKCKKNKKGKKGKKKRK